MIITTNGRARSERTSEESDAQLQREIDALLPDEREALMLMLEEVEHGVPEGGQSLLQLVNMAEYKHEPVDMRTFCKDEYFLGNTCDALYEAHVEDLIELFSGGYQEAIWTGAIGYGKTFVASVGVCRILYEISCLIDPHKSYGLAPGSNISIVNLSVNETLAMKVAFENVATKLKASPYFQENFPFKETKKEFRFPNGVWLAARATTDTSVLGLNVIAGMLDETNFMRKGKQVADKRFAPVDSAETIYNGIKRRMKSRFERRGRLPGMIFLVSSKKTRDDFTARRIQESINDPTVFVRDYALWDVKPEDYYSTKRFFVLCGNEQIPSRILDADEEEKVDDLKVELPDGVSLVDVPVDFKLDFERDLEGSIRDIAGISTVAISPFIQRREKLIFNPKRKHPFSVMVYDPSKPGTFMWERMVQMTQTRDWSGALESRERPIINPGISRHIHIDPAYRKDCVGFCMAHISGWTDVQRRAEDGTVFQERAPKYFVDLILQIIPPIGDEIILGDLRRLVYELSQHGYTITRVTMDTWQSVDAIQQLTRKGYRAEHLSVDTRMEPYDNLKTAFYEDRLDVYDYPVLFRELQQLEKDEAKNKVDHPAKGSKDVSDALAGTLHTLKEHMSTQPLPMLQGLSYSPDEWMEEQLEHSLAHEHRGDEGRFFPQAATPGRLPQGMLPPILGGGQSGGDGWDGGWNPPTL